MYLNSEILNGIITCFRMFKVLEYTAHDIFAQFPKLYGTSNAFLRLSLQKNTGLCLPGAWFSVQLLPNGNVSNSSDNGVKKIVT